MVSLDTIRSENAKLRIRLGPGTVAVFVGGTNGIGEHTLREFARNTDSASIYIVGRNEVTASKILSELSEQNSTHKISFIKADISLLKNVDTACEEISQKEKKINFLFLSPGILAAKGRDDTSEHIPRKLALHYYSRSRFISNLKPLLSAPVSNSKHPTRILTVLGAGYEGSLDTSDLALQKSYNMFSCGAHATTMSSLSMVHLASQLPDTAFVHSCPGMVGTNIGFDSGWLMIAFKRTTFKLAGLFVKALEVEESGERHLWALTSPSFSAASQKDVQHSAIGIDGVQGSGAYLVSQEGEKTGNYKILDPLLKNGWARRIWDHTIQFCDDVVRTGRAS